MSKILTYMLACDAAGCDARVQTAMPTVAEARAAAGSFGGWSTTTAPSSGRGGKPRTLDMCPEHTPRDEEQP